MAKLFRDTQSSSAGVFGEFAFAGAVTWMTRLLYRAALQPPRFTGKIESTLAPAARTSN